MFVDSIGALLEFANDTGFQLLLSLKVAGILITFFCFMLDQYRKREDQVPPTVMNVTCRMQNCTGTLING